MTTQCFRILSSLLSCITVFLLPVVAQKQAPEQAGQAAQEKTRVYVTDSFNREGDAIFSDSTRELGNSVKDACQAILSSASKPQQAASAAEG